MTEKLIEFSARNKFLILLLTAAACIAAVWTVKQTPLDAIPDLSDTQVIVYSRWDRSPDIVEDQVTYPIITALLGTPKVKAIRGVSDFGYSYVYIIFEDGTDLYWARSRTIEYLSKILPQLPEGVKTELGPDATSVGWVFQYALRDPSGGHDPYELRSLQDWTLRYQLQGIPGVAEVASVGGFVRQYQIQIQPHRLAAFKIPLAHVVKAVSESNEESGGRVIEISGAEFMIRGKGYAKSLEDFERIAIGSDSRTGTPIFLSQVARVTWGPDMRRGISDLDGEGNTVGGIVLMRHGENALRVIDRVKKALEEIKTSLPKGVEIVTVYDRSDLILRAIRTLKQTLTEEVIIVSLVILLFLWHIPSAVIPVVTIPVSVLLAFIPFWVMGLTANIMSLAGIAISIGILVDGAIIEVENAYKRLQEWNDSGRKGDFHEVRLRALKEVGPSVFFSLLVVAVSFLPVFTLEDQEGRLFTPLAYSKTFAMGIAALLAVTLDPAMRMLFTRMDPVSFRSKWLSNVFNRVAVGTYHAEERHPISRRLHAAYEPPVRWVLKHPKKTIGAALAAILLTLIPVTRLGSEFMPPLQEGAILYMPTMFPGVSVAQAEKVLKVQDSILKSFPEVDHVFGKAGRAETATDPAPLSMIETMITLKPVSAWPKKKTVEALVREMDEALRLPGVANIWTQPIKNRIDMLATGIRTPVGLKIFGSDVAQIERIGLELETHLRHIRGTRSVYAERASGGFFLDIEIDRHAIARYGLSVSDVQMLIRSGVGGENITYTVEGRERYPVNVRYARDYRSDLEALHKVLVPTMSGVQVPLGQLARMKTREGPAMLRNENGQLAGYVFVDVADRDIGGYVEDAKEMIAKAVQLPPKYRIQWSGQYENMARVKERLKVVLPVTIFLILLLLYFNTRSWVKAGIVLTAVPLSLIGAFWLLYLLGYNLSIAAWVGMIALAGLDAETGVFMLLFLDLAYDERKRDGKLRHESDLHEAIVHGAVRRVRPKIMTVMAAIMGLLPILWSSGTGADVMKRIAAPMVGGLVTSFLLELLVYPAIYLLWKRRGVAARASILAKF
jgi:copper/silver efflux system protein